MAISPVPIIAVILMLFSQRARSNGSAFLVGWVLALVVVGSIVLVLANLGKISAAAHRPPWRTCSSCCSACCSSFCPSGNGEAVPKKAKSHRCPNGWRPLTSSLPEKLLVCCLAGRREPKNLALTLAAALSIAQAGLSGAQAWIVLAVFVIIASLTVAVPVLYYLFAGQSAEKTLNSWKAWLVANNATVMFILLLVLGMLLLGQGLGGLIG